jgi:hypothetical protein
VHAHPGAGSVPAQQSSFDKPVQASDCLDYQDQGERDDSGSEQADGRPFGPAWIRQLNLFLNRRDRRDDKCLERTPEEKEKGDEQRVRPGKDDRFARSRFALLADKPACRKVGCAEKRGENQDAERTSNCFYYESVLDWSHIEFLLA